MSETVKIAKRLVPLEHIVLLEPLTPEDLARIKTERPLKSRVVLLNRESVLMEEELATFAEKYGFRILGGEDGIAANPLVSFSVEAFSPSDLFEPTKPYRSRLMWKDQTDQSQSKLLLAEPETVLAVVIRGEPVAASEGKSVAKRSRRTRRPSTRPSASPS